MASTGLGGGGFALVRDSHGSYKSMDFRETAPAASFADMYKDREDDSLWGGLARYACGRLEDKETNIEQS